MVSYIKYLNENENRWEFVFKNFDYYDGNDLVAKLFNEMFRMNIDDKIDGFWYTIIPLYKESLMYKLIWHEDVGNYMYSENQNKKVIEKLEEQLNMIVDKLNKKLDNKMA